MHPSSKWAYFHRVASYWPNRSETFFQIPMPLLTFVPKYLAMRLNSKIHLEMIFVGAALKFKYSEKATQFEKKPFFTFNLGLFHL